MDKIAQPQVEVELKNVTPPLIEEIGNQDQEKLNRVRRKDNFRKKPKGSAKINNIIRKCTIYYLLLIYKMALRRSYPSLLALREYSVIYRPCDQSYGSLIP